MAMANGLFRFSIFFFLSQILHCLQTKNATFRTKNTTFSRSLVQDLRQKKTPPSEWINPSARCLGFETNPLLPHRLELLHPLSSIISCSSIFNSGQGKCGGKADGFVHLLAPDPEHLHRRTQILSHRTQILYVAIANISPVPGCVVPEC
jgi:hypothetical protein